MTECLLREEKRLIWNLCFYSNCQHLLMLRKLRFPVPSSCSRLLFFSCFVYVVVCHMSLLEHVLAGGEGCYGTETFTLLFCRKSSDIRIVFAIGCKHKSEPSSSGCFCLPRDVAKKEFKQDRSIMWKLSSVSFTFPVPNVILNCNQAWVLLSSYFVWL